MPKVISANRLADGVVVYLRSDASWFEELEEARPLEDERAAEEGLGKAREDVKRSLIVDPVLVEVLAEDGGLRAATLRETIRACGPTIDFRPRKRRLAAKPARETADLVSP